MDTDDLEPPRPIPHVMNLGEMSIEAIGEYIDDLKAEIARAEATIRDKQSARQDAESIFKNE